MNKFQLAAGNYSAMLKFTLALFALIASLSFQTKAQAQTTIKLGEIGQAKTALSGNNSNATRFYFLFENDRFTTPLQEIEFDGEGQGKFRFKRKEQDEIVNKLIVSAALRDQIQSLFSELNFLSGNEDYQHKKDFSHLGTVTIGLARGGKERMAKFNYTTNSALSQLRDIFQNIATQETRIFEMEAVRANDPISMPAQMRLLDNELHSKHIADPQRFVPMLQDMKLDESVPLIARNHAERILQMIKKGK
ncbi:MAG: hypothetical protein M3X11_16350 [Acidobacteriota bacterium]|nr:hypothetical protein [Acidobacteriota bacterium]